MKTNSEVIFLQEGKEYDLDDNLLLDLTKNRIYQGKITFVGSFFSEKTNTSVICYPKYMTNIDEVNNGDKEDFNKKIEDCIEHMNLVCRVIEKCKLSSNIRLQNDFSPFEHQEDNANINKFSIAQFILQDYIEYGLYEIKNNRFGKNARGPINWNKTVNELIPFISDNEVYYLDTINRTKIVDKNQLITKIHSYVVNQCAKLAKDILGFSQIELPNMPELNFHKEDKKRIVSIIRSYMNQVFSNREIKLLKALIAWFDKSKNYIPKMGTNSFNLIWETVCKHVFNHNKDIEEMMPSPYLYLDDKKKFLQGDKASKLIPDILRVLETRKILLILDAKYYRPIISDNSYNKAPGASDVSKQFSYETQLMKLKKESMDINMFSGYKSYNAFLLPHFYGELSSSVYQKLGFTAMLYDSETTKEKIDENDKIHYYQVNPKLFYEKFLSGNSKFTDDEIINFIFN